ncbi:unnamed protein product [Dovyalis caffra]|uniref:Uncharacterized protein n=1 Tax=Dovyalis caffra TaxID=77055 RepID=A0AAV1SBQ0_9ROSI|nr:unnamed protein product [Dovyalis caffra]
MHNLHQRNPGMYNDAAAKIYRTPEIWSVTLSNGLEPEDPLNQKSPSITVLPPKVTSHHVTPQRKPEPEKNPALPPKVSGQAKIVPKVEVGGWKSVKMEQRTFTQAASLREQKRTRVSSEQQEKQSRVIIDSDEDIDGGFCCLIDVKETGIRNPIIDESKEETARILRKARRQKRKYYSRWLDFSSDDDGREIVAGSSDDSIYVYDLEQNKLCPEFWHTRDRAGLLCQTTKSQDLYRTAEKSRICQEREGHKKCIPERDRKGKIVTLMIVERGGSSSAEEKNGEGDNSKSIS